MSGQDKINLAFFTGIQFYNVSITLTFSVSVYYIPELTINPIRAEQVRCGAPVGDERNEKSIRNCTKAPE